MLNTPVKTFGNVTT